MQKKVEIAANTTAEINLSVLRSNVQLLQECIRPSKMLAVVKADAYGHGANRVAPFLEALGVELFGVATIPEGAELRAAGVSAPILVLAGPLSEQLPMYLEQSLDITIASIEAARAVSGFALTVERPVRVHLKVDTGMNRLGIGMDEFAECVELLARPNVVVAGFWTHLAQPADPFGAFSMDQIAKFEQIMDTLPPELKSANLHLPMSHFAPATEKFHFKNLVFRVGIDLYTRRGKGMPHPDLQTIVNVSSRVVRLRKIDAGESVSYGSRWTASRPTTIATVGAGYADGYPRHASKTGQVLIGGKLYPIAGSVCMDMLMVDVGPSGSERVKIGDRVNLFGSRGPEVEDVAEWADTIPYTVTCGISRRVPRIYVDN